MANRGRPSKQSIHATDSKKRKRTPLGERNILAVDNIPDGWEARWINDRDSAGRDRLLAALAAGYEFIPASSGVDIGDLSIDSTKEEGSVISRPVGNGITAYLMAVPMEFAEETREMKRKRVRATEESIKAETDKPGHYGEFKQKTGKYVA